MDNTGSEFETLTASALQEEYIQEQIQIGLQKYLAQLTPDKVEDAAEAQLPRNTQTPVVISEFTSFFSEAPVTASLRRERESEGDSENGRALESENGRALALAARIKSRRELTPIPYKDLYSSDRRKSNKQVPESASFSDARASLMSSVTPTTGLAVGLDTRELCMMASLRPPGINGLI